MASVEADRNLERAQVETGNREMERQWLWMALVMVALRVRRVLARASWSR